MQGIDIHTHVVPSIFPAALGKVSEIPWPSIEHTDCCHARVLVGGKPYRDIESNCWNVEERLKGMDAMGISRQVLSPMPELLSYWLPTADGQHLARHMNEQIAIMVAEAPDRLIGFGMVPLQSPEFAIAEMIYLTEELGLTGIEIGTNIEDKAIGHPDFARFFEAAEARGIPIFVHPLRPSGMDRLIGAPILEQVVAFPCETAFAIASLMTSGMLARHSKLRIAFAHGGGSFGQVLPRMQHAWTIAPGLKKVMPEGPSELARLLYYDTLVYDATALRYLADQFGESQLLVGTDYPFVIMEKEPLSRLREAGFGAADIEAMTHLNALTYLGE